MNEIKERPIKAAIRVLKLQQAVKRTSKPDLPKTESVKPDATPAAPAPLTEDQLVVAARLNFATKEEIRREFRSEGAYIAYMKALLAGQVKIYGHKS